ncbi:uncharacterized protein LOC124701255 [Lolium rigidum]|uniref:uncharacterized protein LOC124701255 n=1 Tax=Lolium rigidum TaxID=89674 RepID=UPI001F5C67FF|nr:uncharacterized protein LOC124701255 [Lolium rigidum]
MAYFCPSKVVRLGGGLPFRLHCWVAVLCLRLAEATHISTDGNVGTQVSPRWQIYLPACMRAAITDDTKTSVSITCQSSLDRWNNQKNRAGYRSLRQNLHGAACMNVT